MKRVRVTIGRYVTLLWGFHVLKIRKKGKLFSCLSAQGYGYNFISGDGTLAGTIFFRLKYLK